MRVSEINLGERVWVIAVPMYHRRGFTHFGYATVISSPFQINPKAWSVWVELEDPNRKICISISRIKQIHEPEISD